MSAKKKIRQIKNIGKKVKAPFISKEAFIFLSFLIFSTLLWFLYKSSHIQELKIDVPVKYAGIPKNIEIAGKLPNTLTVKFKDKGSALFAYLIKKELPPFTIDLSGAFSSSSGRVALATAKYENMIFSTLRPTATQIHIYPDTLRISYYHLYKKTVPVRLNGSIQPALQYILSGAITFRPAAIEVYGMKNQLDTLQAIYTESTTLKEIKDSINLRLNLKTPRGIHLSQASVGIHAPVEAFTEKTLDIPVTSINVPAKYLLRTFPASVKVICQVGISHFKTLQPEDIRAVVDYNALSSNNSGRAKVEVFSGSNYLLKHRVTPDMVDFLLEIKK